MTTEIRYPTPEEWVAYLKEPGRKKATSQFANPHTGGRCCLGHYADMCGISYDRNQAVFRPADSYGATLPVDHWLLESVSDATRSARHQDRLADINDGTEGFDKVIEYIEENLVGKVAA